MLEVVARPVQLMVELVPPTRAPRVPLVVKGPDTAYEEVAVYARAEPFELEKRIELEVKEETPVPPFATLRVPESFGVKMRELDEGTMVREDVRPVVES